MAAHNRKVVDERKRAVNEYNRQVRAHNDQVRRNEPRRQEALRQLARLATSPGHSQYRTSTLTLNETFERLQRKVAKEDSDANDELILGLPAQENANSLEVANVLLGNAGAGNVAAEELQNSELYDVLRQISADLDARWKGALFSLNPANPDAARHF